MLQARQTRKVISKLTEVLDLCIHPKYNNVKKESLLTYESAREDPKRAPGIGAEIVVKTNQTWAVEGRISMTTTMYDIVQN